MPGEMLNLRPAGQIQPPAPLDQPRKPQRLILVSKGNVGSNLVHEPAPCQSRLQGQEFDHPCTRLTVKY